MRDYYEIDPWLNDHILQNMIERIEKEKRELRSTITQLEHNISSLESDLGKMKDRERLLVEYPDLNGPVNANMQGKIKGYFSGLV